MKRKLIITIFCVFIIILLTYSTCFAINTKITKDNLTQAVQNVLKTFSGVSNAEVQENDINVTMDNKNYEVSYDLTSKPTFTVEMEIRDGMTLEQIEEEGKSMFMLSVPYAAILDIYGIDAESGMIRFVNLISSEKLQSDKYVIYEDNDVNTDQEETDDGKIIIKASEFGNYAMEYVNSIFDNANPIVINDVDGIFELKLEQKDVTDTSCKVVAELNANEDNVSENNPSENEQDGEENKNQQEEQTQKTQKPTANNIDMTKANTSLPKTGISFIILYATLGTIIILSIIFGIKYRFLKGIK